MFQPASLFIEHLKFLVAVTESLNSLGDLPTGHYLKVELYQDDDSQVVGEWTDEYGPWAFQLSVPAESK